MSETDESSGKWRRFATTLLVIVACQPGPQLEAEQPPVAGFTERGSLSAIRSGERWHEPTGNTVVPVNGWKKSPTFRHAGNEAKGTEGKRVRTGVLGREGGAGFNVAQAVRREAGKLVVDATVTALGSDRNDGAYYSRTLPIGHFAGWRYTCDEAEGKLPKALKERLAPIRSSKAPRIEGALREEVTKTVIAFYTSTSGKHSGVAFDAGNVALAGNGARLMRVGEGGTLKRESNLKLTAHRRPQRSGRSAHRVRTAPGNRPGSSDAMNESSSG